MSALSVRPRSDRRGLLTVANLNHDTTPIDNRLAPTQTVTILDPRHPLYGYTLPLIGIANRPYLGRCCVVWLQPDVERLIPVSATDLAFDPTDLSPSPLSVAAVEQLLRVVADLQNARTGDHRDAVPARCTTPPPVTGQRRLDHASSTLDVLDPASTTAVQTDARDDQPAVAGPSDR